MSSYTPEQWEARGTHIWAGGKILACFYGGEHWLVGYEDPEAREGPIFGPDPEGRPAEANARLAAAAPALLKALQCESDAETLAWAVQDGEWSLAADIVNRHSETQGDIEPVEAIRRLSRKASALRLAAIALALGEEVKA